MRRLFSRQKPAFKCPKSYLIARFWWVRKMDRLTRGLSKVQLWFSLISFTILGTCLCLYMALKGFLASSRNSMQIDAVSVIRPADKDYGAEAYHIDISAKKDGKQTALSSYIDSVFNLSASVDLCPDNNSIGTEIWSSPITEENNRVNNKKQNDGKQNTFSKRKKEPSDDDGAAASYPAVCNNDVLGARRRQR